MNLTKIALTVLFLALPAYLVRFSIFGLPTNLLDIWLGVTVVIFAVENWRQLAKTKFKFDRWDLGALLILLGATVGIFFSVDKMAALGIWKSWIVAPILIFEILRVMGRKDKNLLANLMLTASIGTAIVAIFGFWELIAGVEDSPDLRLQSLFTNPNQLALLVCPLLVWLILSLFKDRKNLILKIALIVILAVALILTRSYGGLLALAASLFVSFFWLPVSQKWKVTAIVTVVAGVVAIGIFESQTGKFAQALDLQNRSSSSVRLELWQVATALGLQNPVTGIGPGQFEENYIASAYDTLGRVPLEWNHPQPHNLYLAFWLQTGLLGLLGLLVLLISAVKNFTAKNLAFCGALLAILLHGLVDTPFWQNDLALIWWLVIAGIATFGVSKNHLK